MKETKNEIIAAIAIAIHHYENAHSVHEVERTGFRLDKGKISQSWSNKIFMLRKNPYRIK